MNDVQIAEVCHEANRGYQRAMFLPQSIPWEFESAEVRRGVVEGVHRALAGATPEQMHESWCSYKLATGWHYGPVKDEFLKQHPCLVSYDELEDEHKLKDNLFIAIVTALGGEHGADVDAVP